MDLDLEQLLVGNKEAFRHSIKQHLTCNPEGAGNKARRRYAAMHSFLTIRSRIITTYGLNHYYFRELGLDLPGGPKIISASDERIFFPGDIVELDVTIPSKGGSGKIVRLVSDKHRIPHDCSWESWTGLDLAQRFPAPPGPGQDSMPLQNIEIWRNNQWATLEVEFTPCFFRVDHNGQHRLSPPRVKFVSLTVHQHEHREPWGYMHLCEEKPFHAPSEIFRIDSFTRQVDEYFIAQLFNNESRPDFSGIRFPGIGASIQKKHFTRPPHEILGKEIFYA